MASNFFRNYWFGTKSASPDNASSELDSVEQLTSISPDGFKNDLEVGKKGNDSEIEEEGNDFEFINLPDPNEIHSLPYCKVGESVAEIAGFNKKELLRMCTFSNMTYKTTYGKNDTKLSEAGYKTKAELFNEGYGIIPFYYSNGIQAGFVFTKGEEVTIAYRGTESSDDVMVDLNAIFSLAEISPEGQKIYNGMIHSGFHYGFQDSLPSLYEVLATHANEQKVKIKDLKFNFTGHSMGGAVAKIAALYFNKKADAKDIHVATFGAPRVFDLTASKVYNDALQGTTIRVAQDKDPVTMVAPSSFGYDDVGDQFIVKVPPTHGVHRIDGYYQAINDVKEEDFKPNNDVSLFDYPSKVLGYISCTLLGSAQYYANNFSNYIFGESENFFEEVKDKHKIASWFKQVEIERISSTLDSFLHIMSS